MNDSIDKYFYDNTDFLKEASDEYDEGKIDKNLDLKSQIEADGDDKLARLRYIDMRATALAKEFAERDQNSKTLKDEDLFIDIHPAIREVLKRCPVLNGDGFEVAFADGAEVDLSDISLEQRIEIINDFIRHPTYLKSAVNPISMKDCTYQGKVPHGEDDYQHPIYKRMKLKSEELKISLRTINLYLKEVSLIGNADFRYSERSDSPLKRRDIILHSNKYEKEFPWIPILREKNDPLDVVVEKDEETSLWSDLFFLLYWAYLIFVFPFIMWYLLASANSSSAILPTIIFGVLSLVPLRSAIIQGLRNLRN